MSSSGRGRGGKFSKPKRGGGKHFSRDLQPLDKNGEVVGMWGEERPKGIDEEESEEEEDEEEYSSENSDENEKPTKVEMTREERRAAAKARKQAAIARQQQKAAEPGDLPPSESDDDDDNEDMPANPNHTAKARSQLVTPSASDPSKVAAKTKNGDLSQLSRREREALQAQQAKERYEKLHAEGKTDQARADLERLRLVRRRRPS
ncbi:hypothetical protein CC78DRAFT_271036 [Lojkania enalia]|uniref:Casein kinase substrate phosphoprotein PP28 domain-containing protein n=1 Tax=Lojkania enalia TaxID=147567 RepID=A0A9P4K945_9PLEO|nr:hypothetical protein CC78DRAFT_271036 [Didymosphaeria enalia]